MTKKGGCNVFQNVKRVFQKKKTENQLKNDAETGGVVSSMEPLPAGPAPSSAPRPKDASGSRQQEHVEARAKKEKVQKVQGPVAAAGTSAEPQQQHQQAQQEVIDLDSVTPATVIDTQMLRSKMNLRQSNRRAPTAALLNKMQQSPTDLYTETTAVVHQPAEPVVIPRLVPAQSAGQTPAQSAGQALPQSAGQVLAQSASQSRSRDESPVKAVSSRKEQGNVAAPPVAAARGISSRKPRDDESKAMLSLDPRPLSDDDQTDDELYSRPDKKRPSRQSRRPEDKAKAEQRSGDAGKLSADVRKRSASATRPSQKTEAESEKGVMVKKAQSFKRGKERDSVPSNNSLTDAEEGKYRIIKAFVSPEKAAGDLTRATESRDSELRKSGKGADSGGHHSRKAQQPKSLNVKARAEAEESRPMLSSPEAEVYKMPKKLQTEKRDVDRGRSLESKDADVGRASAGKGAEAKVTPDEGQSHQGRKLPRSQIPPEISIATPELENLGKFGGATPPKADSGSASLESTLDSDDAKAKRLGVRRSKELRNSLDASVIAADAPFPVYATVQNDAQKSKGDGIAEARPLIAEQQRIKKSNRESVYHVPAGEKISTPVFDAPAGFPQNSGSDVKAVAAKEASRSRPSRFSSSPERKIKESVEARDFPVAIKPESVERMAVRIKEPEKVEVEEVAVVKKVVNFALEPSKLTDPASEKIIDKLDNGTTATTKRNSTGDPTKVTGDSTKVTGDPTKFAVVDKKAPDIQSTGGEMLIGRGQAGDQPITLISDSQKRQSSHVNWDDYVKQQKKKAEVTSTESNNSKELVRMFSKVVKKKSEEGTTGTTSEADEIKVSAEDKFPRLSDLKKSQSMSAGRKETAFGPTPSSEIGKTEKVASNLASRPGRITIPGSFPVAKSVGSTKPTFIAKNNSAESPSKVLDSYGVQIGKFASGNRMSGEARTPDGGGIPSKFPDGGSRGSELSRTPSHAAVRSSKIRPKAESSLQKSAEPAWMAKARERKWEEGGATGSPIESPTEESASLLQRGNDRGSVRDVIKKLQVQPVL